ncbi:hypothetical protein niasHT_033325 [Heterodera trifolii]|uniref:EGF-like domain-containing protein n=1 Tax=Heterodera trifolii TaxID=157864 RepID=A0ABD2I824_9BILA
MLTWRCQVQNEKHVELYACYESIGNKPSVNGIGELCQKHLNSARNAAGFAVQICAHRHQMEVINELIVESFINFSFTNEPFQKTRNLPISMDKIMDTKKKTPYFIIEFGQNEQNSAIREKDDGENFGGSKWLNENDGIGSILKDNAPQMVNGTLAKMIHFVPPSNDDKMLPFFQIESRDPCDKYGADCVPIRNLLLKIEALANCTGNENNATGWAPPLPPAMPWKKRSETMLFGRDMFSDKRRLHEQYNRLRKICGLKPEKVESRRKKRQYNPNEKWIESPIKITFNKKALPDKYGLWDNAIRVGAKLIEYEGLYKLITLPRFYQQTIGQRERISFKDAAIINRIYCKDSCKGHEDKCQNGGYLNPNDCTKCHCPDGYGGKYCKELEENLNCEDLSGIPRELVANESAVLLKAEAKCAKLCCAASLTDLNANEYKNWIEAENPDMNIIIFARFSPKWTVPSTVFELTYESGKEIVNAIQVHGSRQRVFTDPNNYRYNWTQIDIDCYKAEGGTVSFWGYSKPDTKEIIRVDEIHCLFDDAIAGVPNRFKSLQVEEQPLLKFSPNTRLADALSLIHVLICNDVWLDICPFLRRPQIGLQLALISSRFNALVNKHFDGKSELTIWRPFKIGKMGALAKLTAEYGANSLLVLWPERPLPAKIRFDDLQIGYVDHSVVQFLRTNQKIFDLGTCLSVSVGFATKEKVQRIWDILVREIWPIFATNIHHFRFPTADYLDNLCRRTSPTILTDLSNIC